ncbi:MAG: hypothetical protein JXB36_13470 [Gammaproteobacteria bacterium]|nr:hypothetical protein [Gammaproteobacteria bacterium]
MRAPYLAALLALTATSCGQRAGPEQELRELIAEAEDAAEARDTGHFRDLLSRDYLDARGRTRDDLIGGLRAYFLTHQRVEILTRVEEIEIRKDEVARVVLGVVSMSRSGGRFGGDVERIELELVREDGDWRIIGASWR